MGIQVPSFLQYKQSHIAFAKGLKKLGKNLSQPIILASSCQIGKVDSKGNTGGPKTFKLWVFFHFNDRYKIFKFQI